MVEIKTILEKLIRFESVTPKDAGCQGFMMEFLSQLGFACQRFDNPPVSNFFARLGNNAPLFLFAGHTDVVPIGELSKWQSSPFTLEDRNGLLYGRGSADMKGSLAAMMVMAATLVQSNYPLKGSIGVLITSGEEGDHFNQGTPYVMSKLQQLGIHPDFCIVGEPSSSKKIADVVKIGRRGSLTGKLIVHGRQGHVAYPHLAENPIHKIAPALAELVATEWDKGNEYFPPTSFQLTHIQSGGQSNNIIPGELELSFNFRFSTEQTAELLQAAVSECFKRHELNPSIKWIHSGDPFLTKKGALLESTLKAIKEIKGTVPELSTSGGTSDGRFIAPYGVEVLELGPINASIHQVNEYVSLSDLEALCKIYYKIVLQLI